VANELTAISFTASFIDGILTLMSRPQRIEFDGAYYHVMNRGRGRKDIFHSNDYFNVFLQVLSDTVGRFGLEIHAYCLMTNHYHLLVSTPQGNLQRAMRHVGGVYTQRYNRLMSTDGPLFRGRYKAVLVDSDEYLLHLSKYIHKNPIEAGMVENLADYRWSSYPSYIGKTKPDSWLTTADVYDQLGTRKVRTKRYQVFVEETESDTDIETFYAKQRNSSILGTKDFKEMVMAQHFEVSSEVPRKDRIRIKPGIEVIVAIVAQEYLCDEADLLVLRRGRGLSNFPRKVAMYFAQTVGDYKLTEIAKHFGLGHYGGVSSAIHAVKKAMQVDKKLERKLNSIVKRFDP
jgi:putative transposase